MANFPCGKCGAKERRSQWIPANIGVRKPCPECGEETAGDEAGCTTEVLTSMREAPGTLNTSEPPGSYLVPTIQASADKPQTIQAGADPITWNPHRDGPGIDADPEEGGIA